MALNNAQTKTNSLAFRSMLEKHQLTGPNFNEWFCALKLVVRTEKLQDVFEIALPPAPAAGADTQALADWVVLFDRHNEVACLILGIVAPKLYHFEVDVAKDFEENVEMICIIINADCKPIGIPWFIKGSLMLILDINMKFLRSLLAEWRTHTLIWRNKTDLASLDQTVSGKDLSNPLMAGNLPKMYGTQLTILL
nr:hypothetical protein [Tanacetum cinerariifolium]